MKFNKDGEFIWKTLITGTDPKRVAVDNNDDVVVCGQFGGQNGTNLFFNDQYAGSFSDITNNDVNYYIAKYRYDGMPLWDAGIYISSVNNEFLEGITFDSDNNIYLNGVYEQKLRVYDADEENYIERNWSGYYGGSMFFAKYTPEGDAQWVVNSDDTTLSEIITNPDGSHYLTGTNPVLNGEGTQIMTNADGTTITQSTYGPYYFARITPEGTWDWVIGSTGTDRAGSFEMIKYDDKISIIGALRNWGSQEATTGAIHGTDVSTEISIDAADVFIATYDLEGKLFSVSKSGNNGNDVGPQATSGFMRDENGFFYIQRNLLNYLYIDTQDFYDQAIAPINGNDAAITKFKESDGEMVYLGTKKINPASVKLTPNPTDSDFVISLGNTYLQADMVITDISGKIILQKTYQNVKEIPSKISGAVGVYIAKVIADGEIQTFKVIKK